MTAKCEVCGTTAPTSEDLIAKHAEMRHGYVPEGGAVDTARIFGKTQAGKVGGSGKPPMVEETREAAWPFDPVLRVALIGKGILEPEDLTKAEAILKAGIPDFGEGLTNTVFGVKQT